MARKRVPNKGNRTVSISADRMMVLYTDSNKHFVYHMEKDSPTREVVLFGKSIPLEDKKDFLAPQHRTLLNDLLYSKNKYSKESLAKLPLMRQYNINHTAKKVEVVLNQWKKEIIMKRLDNMLLDLFPNSPVIKQLVAAGVDYRSPAPYKVSIHSLVKEQEIVRYLQDKGLFPRNI